MSWQIPTQIEQDIINGKATYRTFQTGNGGQSILPVPPNSYAVIFGYDFSPAGGGIQISGASQFASDGNGSQTAESLRWFETQQISFYTGTDFFPFIHHVNIMHSSVVLNQNASAPDDVVTTRLQHTYTVDNSPIARQVYITSSNDVTITHGLILNATQATTGAIPVTSRTPGFLTYGGAAQTIQAQTNYGPVGTPQQFMQPSPKDFQDFGLVLLPNNPTDQAFATPDAARGLRESQNFVAATHPGSVDQAAIQYYLCLHYAVYSKSIPETRG